ncbi:trichoplein keratin filament-binding protein-like [Corticium candelabrum]|uniref:trichoplein keratin filament-binding protein-like n=1 Tax=Corticium candelabrum TaxID=121492 RepID=UPI002E268FF3|nr:trichoplein keratin filament-binding protein-like [Corticium candelabrum]
MALPTLQPYYMTKRTNAESLIVRRRTHQDEVREKWGKHCHYFEREGVRSTKQKAWASQQSYDESMSAYSLQKRREEKEMRLRERRERLAKLLDNERSQYEMELKGLARRPQERLPEMREKVEQLKTKRENERRETAEEKLRQHWRANCPEIRQIESRQMMRDIHNTWSQQVTERERDKERAILEKEHYEQELETERQSALAEEREAAEKKRREEKRTFEHLKEQVDEMRRRDEEAAELKSQQDELMRQQWQLQQAEEERKKMEEKRKRQALGRVLTRQYKAQMQRRSRQIQEQLELDLKILSDLAAQEAEDRQLAETQRERARADASWMKQVVEEQLKLEKAREAELDMLFREEASRQWQKREAEWERERLARERLMREVLDERQGQIVEKMEELRIQQVESIGRREELLHELELANQLTARETQRQAEDRETRKRELEVQITERQRRADESRRQLERGLQEQEEADAEYEQMLREEERLAEKRYKPKSYPRRTVAWD